VREWVELSSRTSDPVGLQQARNRASSIFQGLGLRPVPKFTDEPEIMTWETSKGFAGGTLMIAHLDVPIELAGAHQPFRRTPDSLFGEGVGVSRAPLVMIEYALRSFRGTRRLRRLPAGVLLYTDEGRGAQFSAERIGAAAAKARQVLVLRPGTPTENMVVRRRGNRVFRLRVVGRPMSPGRSMREQATLRWTWEKLERFAQLHSQKGHCSVSTLDLATERHPMRLPHRITATILVTYLDPKDAERLEAEMRTVLGKGGPKWELVRDSDRPPMRERSVNTRLFKALQELGTEQQVSLKRDTSSWPSVAGLVPPKVACLCGVGPVTRERGTPNEHVLRISLISRTLLLARFLATGLDGADRRT